MPSLNPEVTQWIRQMGDRDQVVAYFAYQCLLEQVLHTSAPDRAEEQELVAAALGDALTARARSGEHGGSPASIDGNPFLIAVAMRTVEYQHAPRVRANLARFLGYLPHEAAVPYLVKALDDLEAREMARCSLEGFPSDAATEALVNALKSAGTTFRVGVLNSLAKRRGESITGALRRAADDTQPEVRMAAIEALAERPEPSHDAILQRSIRSTSPEERHRAHIARVRLAATLQNYGHQQEALRIYRSILESDAGQPQKKAARLALGA